MRYHAAMRMLAAEPELDKNAKTVLDYALGEIRARRGPEGVDGAALRRNAVSLADAIRRVDGAESIGPEHVLEALQYIADFRTLHGFLKEERIGKQPVGGPGSPIYGRLEAVFREWGRPLPRPTNESLQELAESVGFRFDGPAAGPAAG